MPPSACNIGLITVGHYQYCLFRIIMLHMVWVYHTRAMHPQKSVCPQESLEEFERMRNQFSLAILHIQNSIIDTSFQQNHIRHQYFFERFVIENQEGIISLGLIRFHSCWGSIIIRNNSPFLVQTIIH
jgi:hypothetical protein